MFEVKITIEAPGLTLALNRLADTWSYDTQVPMPTPSAREAVKVESPAPAAAPSPTASVPAPPAVPMTTAAPVSAAAPAAPVSPIPSAVPVAPAPGFTVEQIGKAGADLIAAQPTKMSELMSLLKQYGVDAITQLKPEQLGAFATALRGMGARL